MTDEAQLQTHLLQELKEVRKRGVDRLELPLPLKPVNTGTLEAAAHSLPGCRNNISRIAKIWLLLEREIPLVSQPHQDWLKVMFAIPKELRGKNTGELRKQVARSIGDDDHNFSRSGGKGDQALATLAAQILADCLSGTPKSTKKPSPDSSYPLLLSNKNPSYVRREKYHDQLNSLLQKGAKRIALIGPPGIGKTRLAHQLPLDHASDLEVHCFVVKSIDRINIDIAAALQRYKLAVTVPIESSPMVALAKILNADNGPVFAILDDYDPKTLTLPENCNATIIATTRTRSTLTDGWHIIEIGSMDEREAVNMVQSRLPWATTHECKEVADLAHRHPLTIKYACSLLITRTQLSELQGVSRVKKRTLFKRVVTEDNELLHELTRNLVMKVTEKNPMTAHILAYVGIAGSYYPEGFGIPYVLLKDLLTQTKQLDPELTVDYLDAIHQLRNFGFIEGESYGCLEFHPIIEGVLAEIFRSQFISIHRALIDKLTVTNKRNWRTFDSYDEAISYHIQRVAAMEIKERYIYLLRDRWDRTYGGKGYKRAVFKLFRSLIRSKADLDEQIGALLGIGTIPLLPEERALLIPELPPRLGRDAFNLIDRVGKGAPVSHHMADMWTGTATRGSRDTFKIVREYFKLSK